MGDKRVGRLLVLHALLIISGAFFLQADPITIDIQATIRSIEDADNIFGNAIGIGSLLTGSYTYESAAVDENPLAEVADYRFTESTNGISLNAGELFFQTDPANIDFMMELCNDYGYPLQDAYIVRSYRNIASAGDIAVEQIAWALLDPNHSALSTTDLMTAGVPVLGNWPAWPNNEYFGLQIIGGVPDPDAEGNYYSSFLIQADVTAAAVASPVAVPEPPINVFLLTWLLLFYVALFGQKKKNAVTVTQEDR